MDRDRNLLFGVLAVQLRKVTPMQLVDIAGAWAMDPSRCLGDRLLEAKIVSPEDKVLLDGLVDQAINTFGGDASKTLQAFGGEEEIERSFQGSILITDAGVETKPMTGSPIKDVDTIPAVQESPGRYSQISEYGRGGMGKVLLVHDQYLGRDVALKELLLPVSISKIKDKATPVSMSMQIMARFLQESRITGQLEHPAIVPVYELGHRKDGTLYYTMKLVRGRTLTKAIKEAGSLQARLALLPHFVDLCQAIAYAHSRGVIHRDIKPDNVMVGEFGETVVLDWGLAKAHNQTDVHSDGLAETLRMMNLGEMGEVAMTAYGHAIGTPSYMPPEQATGQLEKVNERSDIYSLGAILYEILTGHSPFTGQSVQDILNKVLHQEPASIRSFERKAPKELIAMCGKAMSKSPEKRYKSAKEFANAVQTWTPRRPKYIRNFIGASILCLLFLIFTGVYIGNIVTDSMLSDELAYLTKAGIPLTVDAFCESKGIQDSNKQKKAGIDNPWLLLKGIGDLYSYPSGRSIWYEEYQLLTETLEGKWDETYSGEVHIRTILNEYSDIMEQIKQISEQELLLADFHNAGGLEVSPGEQYPQCLWGTGRGFNCVSEILFLDSFIRYRDNQIDDVVDNCEALLRLSGHYKIAPFIAAQSHPSLIIREVLSILNNCKNKLKSNEIKLMRIREILKGFDNTYSIEDALLVKRILGFQDYNYIKDGYAQSILDKVVARPGTKERLAVFLYGTPSLRVWHQLDQLEYLKLLNKLENDTTIPVYERFLQFYNDYWNNYEYWIRPVSSLRLRFTNGELQSMVYMQSYINLADISIALGIFQSENGNFPDALEELVPNYVARIPMNPFSGESVFYKKQGPGYYLYCARSDQKDSVKVGTEVNNWLGTIDITYP